MPKNKNKTATDDKVSAARRRNRVAVWRLSALGDVCLAIPVVYAAARTNPDTDFIFVTKNTFVGLCIAPPDNLTVFGVHTKDRHAGPAGLWRLLRELRPDVIVDLHDVLRTRLTAIYAMIKDIRVTVFDKARGEKRRLVSQGALRVPHPVAPTYTRYATALQKAGYEPGELCAPAAPAEAMRRVTALFGAKPADERWIGIAPFAAHAGKAYPLADMARAAALMTESADNAGVKIRLFWFGGRSEATELETVCQGHPSWHVVAGAGLGFDGELALMSMLGVMVSMDSGNMHMAAMMGTDTVSVWGATHPAAGFAPVTVVPGQSHIVLQTSDLECRPCSVFGNKACRFAKDAGVPPCLAAVAPQAIADAVLNHIKAKNV